MSQNKHKGRDARKNEPQREKISKNDVELCLEVEMDDEVRDIITSPEKCTSTLLDVTVIKPKDLDHLYCSQKATLSGDEVKRLITSMELEKKDKQKLIDKILSTNDAHFSVYRQNIDPKSAGDYVKKKFAKKAAGSYKVKQGHYKKDHDPVVFLEQIQKVSTSDDTNSELVYNNYTQKSSKKCDEQQIYTTQKGYSDIKSIFTCKNKSNYDQNDKSDKPCLCRNCAIIGVLTDSQKKPFITEQLYDPRELLSKRKEPKDYKDFKRKKYVNFKEDNHVECEIYFRHLSAKIRQLEERLSTQEEKSVPRDYFKRIITKLVTHLGKITSYAGYDSLNNTRPKSRDREGKESCKMKEKYYVHPLLIDPKLNKSDKGLGDFERFIPSTSYLNSSGKYQQPSEGLWKWGEEILKPGIDLKNKIVMLLEDTLHNWKKPKTVPSKMEGYDKVFCGDFELPQKIGNDVPERDVPNKKHSSCKCGPNANNSNSASTSVKAKHYKSYETRGKRLMHGKTEFFPEESLNVSYMNPQMSKWQEESQISFKLESSDIDSLKYAEERRLNHTYKAEFRDTLSNTKDADKVKLWHSIWTQAKINGQTRDDKVTIQIPERKNMKGNRTIEIEYTIAELEELLIGVHHSSHKHNYKKRNSK